MRCLGPEDSGAGGVKGRDLKLPRPPAEKMGDATAHLFGRLVGEGDSKEILGLDTYFTNEVSKAVC